MAKEYLSKNGVQYLISLIKSDLEKKVSIEDIVNNLNSEESGKPLSALQGKKLQDAIEAISADSIGALTEDDILDILTSTDIDKALSANQGKVLNDKITAITAESLGALTSDDIVNNLTDGGEDKVLSAEQGKTLAGMISSAGNGDMMKAIYDTDDDGSVDNADHADDADSLGGTEASQYALKTYVDSEITDKVTSKIGQADGFAPLDSNKLIDAQYLPSYVDDVVEGYYDDGEFYEDADHTPSKKIKGDTGKIYVDITDGADGTYRWSGTKYIQIVSSDMVEISNEEVSQLWNA